MKIRSGFVSNSSSSSFIVVGTTISYDDFIKKYKLNITVDFEDEDADQETLQEEFADEVRAQCPDLKCCVLIYGDILANHDMVILYNELSSEPKQCIQIIKQTTKLLGKNVRVGTLEQNSEDGNYF